MTFLLGRISKVYLNKSITQGHLYMIVEACYPFKILFLYNPQYHKIRKYEIRSLR